MSFYRNLTFFLTLVVVVVVAAAVAYGKRNKK